MTGEEFLALQQSFFDKDRPEPTTPDTVNERYVYGLKGIAELFDCSISTANRIKNSGTINKAIKQIGRKIIVDAPYALSLIDSKKGGRR